MRKFNCFFFFIPYTDENRPILVLNKQKKNRRVREIGSPKTLGKVVADRFGVKSVFSFGEDTTGERAERGWRRPIREGRIEGVIKKKRGGFRSRCPKKTI